MLSAVPAGVGPAGHGQSSPSAQHCGCGSGRLRGAPEAGLSVGAPVGPPQPVPLAHGWRETVCRC